MKNNRNHPEEKKQGQPQDKAARSNPENKKQGEPENKTGNQPKF